MAQTVTVGMVESFARQLAALMRAGGGMAAFVAIVMRSIADSEVPTQETETGLNGEAKAGKDVEIDDKAFDQLFSEDPAKRSLWWLMNAVMAKSSVMQQSRLKHATGDEVRLGKAWIESLSDGDMKARLLDRLDRLEKDEDQVIFPDLGV